MGIWKIKIRGWTYGAAAGLHKTGGGEGGVVWHFFYLIFRRIIFLHLEIALLFAELRYVFEENIFEKEFKNSKIDFW